MTRKTAKKARARARQEKTGQSYQSALRVEGTEKIKVTRQEADDFEMAQCNRTLDDKTEYDLVDSVAKFNSGNSHFIIDRHSISLAKGAPPQDCYVLVNRHFHFGKVWEPTDKFRPSYDLFPEALEVLKRLPSPGSQPDTIQTGTKDGPVVTIKLSDFSALSREDTDRLKKVPWLKVEVEGFGDVSEIDLVHERPKLKVGDRVEASCFDHREPGIHRGTVTSIDEYGSVDLLLDQPLSGGSRVIWLGSRTPNTRIKLLPEHAPLQKAKLTRDQYTVNDSAFNEVIKGIHERASRESPPLNYKLAETLRDFTRWLRTSGSEALPSGPIEAYLAAEDRVDEYVKGGTARKWRPDNMGYAIWHDVKRMLPATEMERIALPVLATDEKDPRWAAVFKASGRFIEMTVVPNTIRLSTGPDDKDAGYSDQVSAVQAILQHLKNEPKGGWVREGSRREDRDPRQLMDFWKPLPEARKIRDSKQLRLGVTDDHPEKPLVMWTSLARTKSCPGFSEWWSALPEATPYDRTLV